MVNQNKLEQAHLLRRSIDLMSKSITEKIAQEEFAQLQDLIQQRHLSLCELIQLYKTAALEKTSLYRYLVELQQRDQVIIQSIVENRTKISNLLSNVKKLIAYTEI